MSFIDQVINRVFGSELERRVNEAVAALDDSRDRIISAGRTLDRDRWDDDREDILRQALEAWRVNPLARRIVGLTSQYVVGGGIGVECQHEETHKFLQEFWNHRLNRMDHRVFEMCDELTRSGELFLILSSDPSGMSYVRAVPALDIEEIETAPNDLEQETRFIGIDLPTGPQSWAGYNADTDDGQCPVMLHYTVNKAVGALRGESDLAPVLKWLSRYAAWLEDRARLNRFRFAFLYSVQMKGASEIDRRKRQAELGANPPAPGSVLVTDESETWDVLSPKLESSAAGEDGLALKKMISAGCGVPLHFLAEPEGSNKTTAESAGGPTYRHFEQRQEYFIWLLTDLLSVVVSRAGAAGRPVDTKAALEVKGADVSARDNASLAVASSTATSAFISLRDRELIDDAELLRIAYRFAGEVVDVEEMLKRGHRAGSPITPPSVAAGAGLPTDLQPSPEGEQGQRAEGSGQRAEVSSRKSEKKRPRGGPLQDAARPKAAQRPAGVKVDGESGDVRLKGDPYQGMGGGKDA